eukprot:gb/GECG01006344.1/.p1 GENE.gb/GECG01006344.1/~~gb/GECG01006344.1/.p1  ORF type:complete len:564 (+),score=32.33 gb/GECG01006344.1/:1-1692(+)
MKAEDTFPEDKGERIALLVLTCLITCCTFFLTVAWTQYRKNRSLLGYSLRHVFLGSTICQVAVLLGTGEEFSLEEGSPLCQAQSVMAVFGQLYVALWVLGIMYMTYRQANRDKFVPRIAMQRNYNHIRVLAPCIAGGLAIPSAFFEPIPAGTVCLPGDPLPLRAGLLGIPLLVTGTVTIGFTIGVTFRTKKLFWNSFGGGSSRSLHEKNTSSGNKVSPQNQQPAETSNSGNFTTDRSSVTFAGEQQQECSKVWVDTVDQKNYDVGNRQRRSKSFDYFAQDSPISGESPALNQASPPAFIFTGSSQGKATQGTCIQSAGAVRHNSAPPHHFGTASELRVQPSYGTECGNRSSVQDTQPRRQSAATTGSSCQRQYNKVRHEGEEKRKQAGFDKAMSGSCTTSNSYTKGFSSELAIHHGRMSDIPRQTERHTSGFSGNLNDLRRKCRKLCINPRVTVFALVYGVFSIALGLTVVVISSEYATATKARSKDRGRVYQVNQAFAWFMVACAICLVSLFLTHSSIKNLLVEYYQTMKGRHPRSRKVAPGMHVYRNGGSSTVRVRMASAH